MAEGRAMLERAMDLGWVPEHVIATKPPHLWDEVRPLIVTEKLMRELSAQNNPHEALATFKTRLQPHPAKSGLWLALEEIRDPGNLGTIIRTADAAGAAGIILIGDCCDPFAPDCVRATTGSIFAVPLVKMNAEGFAAFAAAFPGDVVGTASGAKGDFRRCLRGRLPARSGLGITRTFTRCYKGLQDLGENPDEARRGEPQRRHGGGADAVSGQGLNAIQSGSPPLRVLSLAASPLHRPNCTQIRSFS
jgi:hypothetical protein